MKYYHISPTEFKESIIANGLKANDDGDIFVFNLLEQANWIAINQVFIQTYTLFEINSSGFIAEPIQDNVAESGANTQFIIKQAVIAPEYVNYINDVNLDYMMESMKQEFETFYKMNYFFSKSKKEAEQFAINHLRQHQIGLDYLYMKYKKHFTLLKPK